MAIYVGEDEKYTIPNGTVYEELDGYSGAFIVEFGELDNAGTVVFQNCSGTRGGAIGAWWSDGINISNAEYSCNSAWEYGGAIYVQEAGVLNFTSSTFSENVASQMGGAIALTSDPYSPEGCTVNIYDCTFTQNDSKQGGAIYVDGDYTLNLKNVTFNDNNELWLDYCGKGYPEDVWRGGGAIYAENYATLNIQGSVTLVTENDTIILGTTQKNELTWDLASAKSDTDYNFSISNWALVTGNFNSIVKVADAGTQVNGTYTLAQNVNKTFTVTLQGGASKTMSVSANAPAVTYATDNQTYTLALNKGTVTMTIGDALNQRTEVSWVTFPPDGKAYYNFIDSYTIANLNNPTLNGGAFYVDSNGDLTVSNATFSANQGKLGGAIYTSNGGKLTLSNVVFSGNTSSGDESSGAIYNMGTTTLTGSVTLSSNTDTIYNIGELIWDISTSGCGYVSDFSKIDHENGVLVVAGSSDRTTYGTYKLADNATGLNGYEFTLRGKEGDKTITVNGSAIVYSQLCNARLYTNMNNTLYLQLSKVQQVVENGTYTIQNGTNVDMSGMAAYSGNGALFYVESSGTLNNNGSAEFIGSSVTGSGAVIYNKGVVNLQNCTFSSNSSREHGGALYNAGRSVTITDSTFSNNKIEIDRCGGAIAQTYGSMRLQNVVFNGNTCGSSGGAILVNGSGWLYLDNVTFKGNRASVAGGAVHVDNGGRIYLEDAVTLATSSDTINLCSNAMMTWVVNGEKTGYLSDYSLITGTKNTHTLVINAQAADKNTTYVLADNAASANGQEFSVTLKDGNSKAITVNGDAVQDKIFVNYRLITNADNQLVLTLTTTHAEVRETVTVKNGGIIDLTGFAAYDGDGGAIYVIDSMGKLLSNENSKAAIVGSSATGNGGGIENEWIVNMDTVTLTGNTAGSDGGAVHNAWDGTTFLTNSTFKRNTAGGNGGAVYLCSGTNTLSGTFIENNATQGGAIYVESAATLNLGDAVFQDNVATSKEGGAVYNLGTVNLTGKVALDYKTDTFYNAGTLNWNLAQGASLSGYENLKNAGTLTITVNADMPVKTVYTIATGDFSYLTNKSSFTLTGVGGTTANITVNGDTVEYNNRKYTLNVANNTMTLVSESLVDKRVVNSDIDGDGISDVVFQWLISNHQVGYWVKGTNKWIGDGSDLAESTKVVGAYDMDSDGLADTVLYDSETGVLEYAPGGSTANLVSSGILSNAEKQVVKLGNLTGQDGKNSYVIHNTESGKLTVWENGDQAQATELAGNFEGPTWTLAGTGSFDGSSTEKAVLMDDYGNVKLLGLDDTEAQSLCMVGAGWDIRAIGDFSNDGIDDLVFMCTDSKSENFGVMFMMEDGYNYKVIGQLDGNDWFICGAGDYDGDQKDDLLVRQYSTGMLGYYPEGIMPKSSSEEEVEKQWKVLGYGVDMDWNVTIA